MKGYIDLSMLKHQLSLTVRLKVETLNYLETLKFKMFKVGLRV